MGVDRRIEALERAWQSPGTLPEEIAAAEERQRIIEEIEALRPAFEEKMAAEEARGDFRRRQALEELEEQVERRMRGDHR